MLRYLLLLLSFNVQAAELDVNIDSETVEYGKYLNVKIDYHGSVQPGDINLELWERSFYVDLSSPSTAIDENFNVHVSFTARLYPLSLGALTLAPIAYGGSFSEGIEVKAIAAIRNAVDTTPIWQPLPQSIWVDQPLHIRLDVPLFHPSNRAEIEPFNHSVFEINELPKVRGQLKNGQGKKLPVERFQWLLFAPREGLHKIKLPRIEQRGRSRLRYFLAEGAIEVKPLPSYLPSTLLVGKPSIEASIDYRDVPRGEWLLKVKLAGRMPTEVFGLRKQLAKLSGRSIDQVKLETIKQIGLDASPAEQIYRVALPDLLWPSWFQSFSQRFHLESLSELFSTPEIKLAYFETKQDFTKPRLQYLSQPLMMVWRAPLWLDLLLGLTLLMILGSLFLSLVAFRNKHLTASIRRWKLSQISDPHKKRQLLLQDELSFQSLSDWAGDDELRRVSAAELNKACFSDPEKTV